MQLHHLKRHKRTHLTCGVVGCRIEFHKKKKLDAHKRKLHKPLFVSNICPKQGPKKHRCRWCEYETRYSTNIGKHEKICAVKKRAEGPDLKQHGKEELGLLYSMTNKCSIKEFNVILDFFTKKFGKEWCQKGSKQPSVSIATVLTSTMTLRRWHLRYSSEYFSLKKTFWAWNSYFPSNILEGACPTSRRKSLSTTTKFWMVQHSSSSPENIWLQLSWHS